MQLRPPLPSQNILLHYGRWFPAYFISSIYAENQTWVNKFLRFCIRRNIFFLGKMDIGIRGGKNKNITVGMVFYFFSRKLQSAGL